MDVGDQNDQNRHQHLKVVENILKLSPAHWSPTSVTNIDVTTNYILGDMSNEELVELFNEPAFAALSNPNNWDRDTIAQLLGAPITPIQLRDANIELLGLISANQVDELNDAFISLVELVYEAQNVLERGFNTEGKDCSPTPPFDC